MTENNMNEINMEEMALASGGANRYAALTPRDGFIIYKVQAGDNLSKIAIRHHCTVNDLLRWNPKITNKNQIYVNEYLYIQM